MAKEEVKRFGIQMNLSVYEKLKSISDGYGITPNSLITYVMGQWVDSNYNLKEKINNQFIDAVVKKLTDITTIQDDSIQSKQFQDGMQMALEVFSKKLTDKKIVKKTDKKNSK